MALIVVAVIHLHFAEYLNYIENLGCIYGIQQVETFFFFGLD
jgi:hypothetical protein